MATFRDVRSLLIQINRDLVSPRLMRMLARQTRTIIFRRTKSGFGVNDDQSPRARKQRLRRLAPSTIRQRRRNGVLGSFGNPASSNLTDTGQMLDSIDFKIGKGEYTLLIPNSTRRKKGREKRVPTNAEVAEFVSEERPFFNLTVPEQQILVKMVRDRLRKIVRSLS